LRAACRRGILVPLLAAEAAAASVVTFLASAIVAAYAADWCGLPIVPPVILIVAIAAAAMVFARLRPSARGGTSTAWTLAIIVAAAFGWLLWLARPDFLPTGSGPDLVHHLALIEYIEAHSRLVHDVRLS